MTLYSDLGSNSACQSNYGNWSDYCFNLDGLYFTVNCTVPPDSLPVTGNEIAITSEEYSDMTCTTMTKNSDTIPMKEGVCLDVG